jgi:hypothetical protein
MHRITKTPWFIPKKDLSGGWRINNLKGLFVVSTSIGILVLDIIYFQNDASLGVEGILLILVVLFTVVRLTGTPPGIRGKL